MSRSVRVIVENKLYEVVARAREGLPLPPTGTTNALLSGIMARTQRHDEVTLCNYVWMNNHSHKHVIPKNPEFLPRFYCEILKKTTDSLRTLLGKNSLRIWEDRASVVMLAELEDCIRRVIYIFCNPTKAGLVDTIEEYPGLTSWKAFVSCEPSVEAEVRTEAVWCPVSGLPTLPKSHSLTEKQDKHFLEQLGLASDLKTHTLIVKPFAWLSQFGITKPEEIEKIRQKIISGVRENEAIYRAQRLKDKKRVVGAKRLKELPYMSPHQPKLRARKIFLICTNKELRLKLLKFYQGVFDRCRECYERIKKGATAVWPPGTFIPWLPPNKCSSLDGVCV